MAFDTAANILNDVAVELGLRAADLDDPFGSTDPNILQLCRMLKGLGRELVTEHAWSHLEKTHTLETVASTTDYELPADFSRLLDSTARNQTSAVALGGPLSARRWQDTGPSFRLVGHKLRLNPAPTGVETLAFEYVSEYWVRAADASAPNKSAPTLGSDVLHFDSLLLSYGLKLRWLSAKGFPTDAALQDYQRRLSQVAGGEGASPVLNLTPRTYERLLDEQNIGGTGYGSGASGGSGGLY